MLHAKGLALLDLASTEHWRAQSAGLRHPSECGGAQRLRSLYAGLVATAGDGGEIIARGSAAKLTVDLRSLASCETVDLCLICS